MNYPMEEPVSGKIMNDYPIRWITFETDDHGKLLVRTLRGFKVIDDPAEAERLLKIITDAVGI